MARCAINLAVIMARAKTSTKLRVLIVDDHPIVVSGCRAMLANEPNIVVNDAADADSGEAAFADDPSQLCVIDINLPGVSGFELARRVLRRDADARIIMFSMNDDPIFAARAIETGAKGYVSKSGDPGDLVSAIRAVAEGGTFLPPSLAQSLAFAGPTFASSRLAKLTSREIEILRLIGAGKSLTEIAWMINASYKTVANTSSIILHKLGVRSSSELVRVAIESRLA
jgi:DNA-binding NarL/FixJ family response regulator